MDLLILFVKCGYSIVLMVSRLINSLVHMCVLLFFSQSAIGRAWEEQYLGLVFPPVGGLCLLGLDGDADGVLRSSQTHISLGPDALIIKDYGIFKVQ